MNVRRGERAYMDYDDPSRHSYHQSAAPWSNDQQQNADEEDYSPKSVAEIRQKFNAPPAHSSRKHGVLHLSMQPGMPSYVPKRPTMFKKKEPLGAGMADPGWVPMMGGHRQQMAPQARRYAPIGHHSPPVNRAPQQLTPPMAPPARDRHYEPPAWVGSLRHSGGPRPWELAEAEHLMGGGKAGYRSPPQTAVQHPPAVASGGGGEPVAVHNPRLQTMRYGPGPGSGTYEQQSAVGQDSDSARVAHLQYNTPIGLYSRENAQAALQAQTSGKAGHGTLQITGDGQGVVKSFNPAQSNVLHMVAEEDQMRSRTLPSRRHAPVHSDSRQHHDAGHGRHHHMHAGGGGQMMGTSDF